MFSNVLTNADDNIFPNWTKSELKDTIPWYIGNFAPIDILTKYTHNFLESDCLIANWKMIETCIYKAIECNSINKI